jgi:hypothetical protein
MARTRQPQGPTRIDWSNPLTRGLRSAILPHLGFDAVANNLQSAGTRTVAVRNYGLAKSFAAGNTCEFAHRPNYALTGEMSVAALFQELSGSTYGGTIASKATSDNNSSFDFRASFASSGGDQKPILTRGNGTAYRSFAVSTATPAIRDSGAFIAASAPSTIQSSSIIYINGLAYSTTDTGGTGTGAAADASTAPLRLGNRYDGAISLVGYIGVLYLWNRMLSSTEHAALYVNPWQLFAPSRRVWMYLGPATGGATEATITSTQDTDLASLNAAAAVATVSATIASTQATDLASLLTGNQAGPIASTQLADLASLNATAQATAITAGIASTQDTDLASLLATNPASISSVQSTDVASLNANAQIVSGTASIAATQLTDTAALAAGSAIQARLAVIQASDICVLTAGQAASAQLNVTQFSDSASLAATAEGGAPPDFATSLWVQAQMQSKANSQRTDAAYARYIAENPFFELGEGSPEPGTFFSNGKLPGEGNEPAS